MKRGTQINMVILLGLIRFSHMNKIIRLCKEYTNKEADFQSAI